MVNIIIATHGPLAEALKETAYMFFDELDDVKTCGLFPGQTAEELKAEIEQVITSLTEGSEVLILVDMLYGTPFNVAAMIMGEIGEKYNIDCYTGVNMPILMETLSNRNGSRLEDLVEHLNAISNDTMKNLKQLF